MKRHNYKIQGGGSNLISFAVMACSAFLVGTVYAAGFQSSTKYGSNSGGASATAGNRLVVVQEAKSYNSWPVIAKIDDRIICSYSRGSEHTIDEGQRGAYVRVSVDGGASWGDEICLTNNPVICEGAEGAGNAGDDSVLLWVRCTERRSFRHKHELYRTRDGVNFNKISQPNLSPTPIQITDIFTVPGVGLMAMWFSGNYQIPNGENSWGTLISKDDGRTWIQCTIESNLPRNEWPTEISAVSLGGGRLLAIGRSERGTGSQFQLTSLDGGVTWRKYRTNISDVYESTPSLVYDQETDKVYNYYYQRGPGILWRRVARATAIFDNPKSWPIPVEMARGGRFQPYDSGNVKAIADGNVHHLAFYSGDPTNTAVVVVTAPAVENVSLINAGFESVTKNGDLEGWQNLYKPLYVDAGAGRDGGNALAFSASKKGRYVVLGQSLPACPGMTFRASFWSKSENLTGGHPMLCLEWYGEGGRWLGGNYGKGKNGTSGWREEHVAVTRAPKGTVSMRVGVCVTKSGVGKAWFDDIRLETVDSKVVQGLYSSVYRDRAVDGIVTFFADLNLDASYVSEDDVSAEFSIPFAKGHRTLTAKCISNGWAYVSVDASELKSGKVQFALKNQVHNIGSAELMFTRMDETPKKGISFDCHRRLVVDGKPVFPIGMYWGRVTAKDLDVYAKGPFNFLMPYVPVNREQLDLCNARGLKAFCNIKDWYTFVRRGRDGISTIDDVKRKIRSVVEELRDHPALLGWYMNDEIPIVHIDELTACYKLVRELDPMHPTWTMLYLMPDMRGFLPTFDIGGTDPYPHEEWKQWRNAYDWPKQQIAAVFGSRPVWQAVQAHDSAAYKKESREELMKTHPTSIEELRSLTWQALTAGANGLSYYSFFDLQKMSWKTPFEESFGNVCLVAEEVRRLENVLLLPDTSPVSADTSDIGARIWRDGSNIYLAVANLRNDNTVGCVAVDAQALLTETLLGVPPVSVDKGFASFKFRPFDVSFVRLSFAK